MAVFNHIVGALVAPLPIGILMLVAALAVRRRWRRASTALAVASAVWTWAWSCPFMTALVARPLERAFPDAPASESAQADAIVLLGGGMGADTNECANAEMFSNADRVWHAARLYRAGKAPLVICTSKGTPLTTAPLLRDLGVPAEAIACIEEPRNTEEEGRFVASAIGVGAEGADAKRGRILLVTSAWHMRRSLLMFRKAMGDAVEVIPAPCDYEATANLRDGFEADWFWPSAAALQVNSAAFKEVYACWAYRILRGY
ncbi:MAG: YdcF family protein [Kiritimatiellae bacterium]|nr:YdcF family protein [Kiritimatiellia bacterium]